MEVMNNLYSNRIKEVQLQILRNQFELISKNTILQLSILKQLFDEPKSQVLYEEALSNEIIIDRLEVKIREEVAFTRSGGSKENHCVSRPNDKSRANRGYDA